MLRVPGSLEKTIEKRMAWKRMLQRFNNPVILKEIRSWMRTSQAFAVLTVYLIVISLIVFIVYQVTLASTSNPASDPNFRQTVGKAIFGTVVILELLLAALIGPALTSGAVSSERERRTFDLLRTTTLSARSFVLGKLGAALLYLILLIVAAMPIESIAFLLGGVGLAEILISSLMMIVCALFFCSLGLFFSSFMRRTLGSTVGAYVVIVLSVILLVVAFVLIFMNPNLCDARSAANDLPCQKTLIVIVWILASTNPLLAAGISESMLTQSQNAIMATMPLGLNLSVSLPLPWIPLVGLYIILSVFMIWASIHFVSRPDQ